MGQSNFTCPFQIDQSQSLEVTISIPSLFCIGLQFSIKGSFAITIINAQGQIFQYVGIDLRFDCFPHGQLYAGLSRKGNSENQFILLPHGLQTKNVVYSEIFLEQYFPLLKVKIRII